MNFVDIVPDHGQKQMKEEISTSIERNMELVVGRSRCCLMTLDTKRTYMTKRLLPKKQSGEHRVALGAAAMQPQMGHLMD
jgi:hypothetical protein